MMPAVCTPSQALRGPERGKQECSEETELSCSRCGMVISSTTTTTPIIETREQLTSEQLREKIITKEEHIAHLQTQLALAKQSLQGLVEKKNTLAELWGKVLRARSLVDLTRKAYETKKKENKIDLEKLQLLEKNNRRRLERLKRVHKRVHNKDFAKKENSLRSNIAVDQAQATRQFAELVATRREFITQLYHRVFPIEVLPLSDEDAGAEDYQNHAKIDCDSVLDLDEGWILGGVHSHPTPHISIVSPSLPVNGDHTPYLRALSERTNSEGVILEASLHPMNDPLTSTPAALAYIAQFVEIIAFVLDQPLLFTLPRPVAISEYGTPVKGKRMFLNSVARLDDNIMYLCFSQNVPHSALSQGHTLQNLLALVTHCQLGRNEAFVCSPELMCYRRRRRERQVQESLMLAHDLDDNQPPNLSYTTDTPVHEVESEGEEEEEEEEEDEDDWETHANNSMEWEHLEPTIEDIQLFEEEQMKIKLQMKPTSAKKQKQVRQQAQEAELRRQRVRRLDYNSTYMDYAALMGTLAHNSSSSSSSVVDTVRSLDSIEERAGDGEVSQEQESEINLRHRPAMESNPSSQDRELASTGIFGALSSLWSSTFGSNPS